MMKSQEYAKSAAEITKYAEYLRPQSPEDEFREARLLAVYHLKAAASKLRQVAEHLASKEATSL